MFTGVCLSTGGVPGPGGVCSGAGVPALEGVGVPAPDGRVSAPGGNCSRGGCLVPGGVCLLPGRCLLEGVPAPGGCLVETPHGYCCGQYASYWNAFLYTIY